MPIALRHQHGREIDQERRYTERPRAYPAGRRCSCGSLLSRYNPGPSCWVHTPERYQFVDSLGELTELMSAP